MGSNDSSSIIISFSIAILLLLVLLLLISYNSKCNMDNVERFDVELQERPMSSNENINYIIKNDNHKPEIKSVAGLDKPALPKASDGNNGPVSASSPPDDYSYINNTTNTNEGFTNGSGNTDTCDSQTQNCFNRDRLSSSELLPLDPGNSKWGEMNPSTSGLITDQSFLTAGYHIGINTIGQSLRNANLQLRSEPPNPQIPVSPWGISTIEPDIRQVGFEIGSAASK